MRGERTFDPFAHNAIINKNDEPARIPPSIVAVVHIRRPQSNSERGRGRKSKERTHFFGESKVAIRGDPRLGAGSSTAACSGVRSREWAAADCRVQWSTDRPAHANKNSWKQQTFIQKTTSIIREFDGASSRQERRTEIQLKAGMCGKQNGKWHGKSRKKEPVGRTQRTSIKKGRSFN